MNQLIVPNGKAQVSRLEGRGLNPNNGVMNQQLSISSPMEAETNVVDNSQLQFPEEHDIIPIFDIKGTYPMMYNESEDKLPQGFMKIVWGVLIIITLYSKHRQK